MDFLCNHSYALLQPRQQSRASSTTLPLWPGNQNAGTVSLTGPTTRRRHSDTGMLHFGSGKRLAKGDKKKINKVNFVPLGLEVGYFVLGDSRRNKVEICKVPRLVLTTLSRKLYLFVEPWSGWRYGISWKKEVYASAFLDLREIEDSQVT